MGRSLRGRVPAPVLGVHGLELAVDLRQPAAVLPLEQLVADRFKARSEAQAWFAKNAKERSIRVLFTSHWAGCAAVETPQAVLAAARADCVEVAMRPERRRPH